MIPTAVPVLHRTTQIPVSFFSPPASNGRADQVVSEHPPGRLTEMSDARRGLDTASPCNKNTIISLWALDLHSSAL